MPSVLNLQPILQGTHFRLRPLETTDFEALYAVASDPLIWEQHPESTRYQREVFQGFFAKAMASQGALVVEELTSGGMIGCSRYYDLDSTSSQVAIGFTFLARAFWGGGANREVKKLMLEHAFLTVDTVLFHVAEGNLRSRKALLKIGAVEQVQTTPGRLTYALEKTG